MEVYHEKIALILALFILTLTAFPSCEKEDTLNTSNTEDISDKIEFIFDDPEIIFISNPSFSKPLGATSFNFDSSDTGFNVSDAMRYYLEIRPFVDCETNTQKLEKLNFAGEEIEVTYSRSMKYDNTFGTETAEYDVYDIYIDKNENTYCVNANGVVNHLLGTMPEDIEAKISDEDALKIADDYLEKVFGERAEKYEFSHFFTSQGTKTVVYQLKMDGVKSTDRVLIYIDYNNNVRFFHAPSPGIYDYIAASITKEIESNYVKQLENKLSELKIKNYTLNSEGLVKYNGQLYFKVVLDSGMILVDNAEYYVSQTSFYICVNTAS